MLFLVFHFNSFVSFCQLIGFISVDPLRSCGTRRGSVLNWAGFTEGLYPLLLSFSLYCLSYRPVRRGVDSGTGEHGPLFF